MSPHHLQSAAALFLGLFGPMQASTPNQNSGLIVMAAGVLTALLAFWLRWRRQRP